MSAEMRRLRLEYYKQWEAQFDVALKEPGPKDAWATLIAKGCNAQCLKGAIFYAGETLKRALEFPAKFEEFSGAKARVLDQVAELRTSVESLMSITAQGQRLVDQLMFLREVSVENVRLFQHFPRQIEEFERTLEVLSVPSGPKRDNNEDREEARGELLLHAYLNEITGNYLYDQTSVLLEAGAGCCRSLGRLSPARPLPQRKADHYSSDAVRKRHGTWFISKKNREYKEVQVLVRRLKNDGESFLQNFLNARLVKLTLEISVHNLGRAKLLREMEKASDNKESPLF